MSDSEVRFGELRPDSGERFQRLRAELGVSSFGLNLLVLEPGQQGRVHAHERQEEVYLVLEGTLTLELQGETHALGEGRLARVGPDAPRRLANAGTERVVLLALGGSGEHDGRDGRAWASWDEGGPGRPPQDVPLPQDRPSS